LIIAPYNLVLAESIYVKVVATNFYGDSPQSLAGNGAQMQLVPDAPISLANNKAVTDAFKIGLTWKAGASDGGSPVLDYTVYYSIDGGSLEAFEPVTTTSYVTTVELVPGGIYVFKITARNSVGSSVPSATVTIKAARIPDPPANVQTVTMLSTNVVVSWNLPYDGGASISSYTIVIMTASGSYVEDMTNCDGRNPTILAQRTCTIPITALKAVPYSHPWGASIFVKVLATNEAGPSAFSVAGNGAIILTLPEAP